MSNLFICHSNKNAAFVIEVVNYLKKMVDKVFYYEFHQRANEAFTVTIDRNLRECDSIIIFIGSVFSKWQVDEVGRALTKKNNRPNGIVIRIKKGENIPELPDGIGGYGLNIANERLIADPLRNNEPRRIAWEILNSLHIPYSGIDDLPYNPNLFSYEKDIIDFYKTLQFYDERIFSVLPGEVDENLIEGFNEYIPPIDKSVELTEKQKEYLKLSSIREKIQNGCPLKWPSVKRWETGTPIENNHYPTYRTPLAEENAGYWRKGDPSILAAALNKYHTPYAVDTKISGCMLLDGIVFPEAGPREHLYWPKNTTDRLKIAIIVAGGIAPGINSVIDGIVQRHWMYGRQNYYTPIINGMLNGLYAFEFNDDGVIVDTSNIIYLYPDETTYRNIPTGSIQNNYRITSTYAGYGGSMIGTSRVDELIRENIRDDKLKKLARYLKNHYHIVYVIGGDGSMKFAHALYHYANIDENGNEGKSLSVIAIPKTMDNDILWVWQSFGFSSAVEKGREIIETVGTEIKSNPRLGIIQLFGSDSGFVVSHSVAASTSGLCDAALIPEVKFSLYKLSGYIKGKMCTSRLGQNALTVPSGLIVMAETAIPTDAVAFVCQKEMELHNDNGEYTVEELELIKNEALEDMMKIRERIQKRIPELDWEHIRKKINLSIEELTEICKFNYLSKKDKRIQGQTNDPLRSAGLKIVSQGLQYLLKMVEPLFKTNLHQPVIQQPDWLKLRVVTNEPRHILRASPPTSMDIITAHRLGTLAVDSAMAGFTDFMISQWLTEFVMVPLKLVVIGRKHIPETGMFWKSILAKTDQFPDLDEQIIVG